MAVTQFQIDQLEEDRARVYDAGGKRTLLLRTPWINGFFCSLLGSNTHQKNTGRHALLCPANQTLYALVTLLRMHSERHSALHLLYSRRLDSLFRVDTRNLYAVLRSTRHGGGRSNFFRTSRTATSYGLLGLSSESLSVQASLAEYCV